MNEADLDRRLALLLSEPEPPADPDFADRVLAVARIDRQIRRERKRAWRRAVLDCGAAIAVAATFYLLSQEQAPLPNGMLSLQGTATAGLIMLALWALVSTPTSTGQVRPQAAP
jgi:hypothetical protein